MPCAVSPPGSVGILLAGMTAICPSRKAEITALGGRALIGGVLASLSTGAVVGILAAF